MKNWLPPSYGKKPYTDMTPEEQDIIDNFQGKAEYEKVIKNYNKYIYDTKGTNLLTF